MQVAMYSKTVQKKQEWVMLLSVFRLYFFSSNNIAGLAYIEHHQVGFATSNRFIVSGLNQVNLSGNFFYK